VGTSLVLDHCRFSAEASHVVSDIQPDSFCKQTFLSTLHVHICMDASPYEYGDDEQDWKTVRVSVLCSSLPS
jgi:hypothetical protein